MPPLSGHFTEMTELWVPREAPEQLVQDLICRHRNNGRVVVFRSGTRNLTESARELLRANLP